jgi:hypothetical protein
MGQELLMDPEDGLLLSLEVRRHFMKLQVVSKYPSSLNPSGDPARKDWVCGLARCYFADFNSRKAAEFE